MEAEVPAANPPDADAAGPANPSAIGAVEQESTYYRSEYEYIQWRFKGLQTKLKECVAILKPCLTSEGDSAARNAIIELKAMNYRLSHEKEVKSSDEAMDYRVEHALIMKKTRTFETKLRKHVPVAVMNPNLMYTELSEWKAVVFLESTAGL